MLQLASLSLVAARPPSSVVRPPIDRGSLAPVCTRADARRLEGVHADPSFSPLVARVLERVPELGGWEGWYKPPRVLSNGHVHTILAAKLRSTRAVRYHRQLVQTQDGGTLAIDLLAGIRRVRQKDAEPWAALLSGSAIAGADEGSSDTFFVQEPPPLDPSRPMLLLASGLGGAGDDSRALRVYAPLS